MKTDLFQSCGHCWVFQLCWHIECSTFTASSFRIWSRSTGILSPPLALFVVVLPKAHLTSHSRMSNSRWVIIPSWLFGSWRSLLYSSSVYSCYLFLISSASVRSIPCGYFSLIPRLLVFFKCISPLPSFFSPLYLYHLDLYLAHFLWVLYPANASLWIQRSLGLGLYFWGMCCPSGMGDRWVNKSLYNCQVIRD